MKVGPTMLVFAPVEDTPHAPPPLPLPPLHRPHHHDRPVRQIRYTFSHRKQAITNREHHLLGRNPPWVGPPLRHRPRGHIHRPHRHRISPSNPPYPVPRDPAAAVSSTASSAHSSPARSLGTHKSSADTLGLQDASDRRGDWG